jgi:RNA polymerase sigma factor (sigma-70 family)
MAEARGGAAGTATEGVFMVAVLHFPDASKAAALAALVTEGQRAAENTLASLFYDSVRSFLSSRTRDQHAAAELADDVLMAALLALRKGVVRDPAKIGAFIHGIAVHVANSHLRRQHRQLPVRSLSGDIPDAIAADQVAHADQLDAVHRVLEALEETDRRILGMLLDEGLSECEVAERMSLKVATVRQRKRRMILKLGERLRDH